MLFSRSQNIFHGIFDPILLNNLFSTHHSYTEKNEQYCELERCEKNCQKAKGILAKDEKINCFSNKIGEIGAF